MQEDYLKSKLIENSTSLLTDFFNVISDGYNPTLISVTIDLTKNIENEEIFIYKTHSWVGTKEEYYQLRQILILSKIELMKIFNGV